MIQDFQPERWILNIYGEAGIGKTRLIARLSDLFDESGLGGRRTGVIDFYDLANRRKVGLIRIISDSLGLDLRPVFGVYDQVSRAEFVGESRSAEELRRAEEAVIEKFREELTGLRQNERPLVLFFDTFDDNVQRTNVGQWFVSECLPLINQAVPIIAVVGGRQSITAPAELEPHIVGAYLGKLTQQETADFFVAMGLGGLGHQAVKELWERAGQGRPILVAILADWLTKGQVSPGHILDIPPDRFEPELLRFILSGLEVGEDERRLLLLMAHLHHRFDAEVFRAVHSAEDGELFDPNPVFSRLARFSFVKYRPHVPSCLLHDEMRELIHQQVFPEFDTAGDTRSRWSKDISAHYYSPQIAHASERMTAQTLQAEQLYHECFAYVNSGEFNRDLLRVKPARSLPEGATPLTVFWYRLDESWRPQNLDQMELLLQVLTEAWAALRLRKLEVPEEKARFQNLCWIREAGLGWLCVSQRQFGKAEEALQRMLSDQALPARLRATVLAVLGESAFRQADDDKAVEYLRQALALFDKLGAAGEAQPPLIATEMGIPAERHRILNTFGVIHRRHGELDQALEEFEQAFRLAKEAGDDEWIAAAQNNMGNIYRYQGRYEKARTHCRRAMKRRRDIGYEYDIGLSHNTLGLVYRDLGEYADARMHTEDALRISREYNDAEFQVRALINLGYIAFLTGHHDEAMDRYREAQRLCERTRLELELPRLFSKWGLVYQALGDFRQAEEAFREGHALAEEKHDALYEVVNLEYLARLKYAQGDKGTAIALATKILKHRKAYQFRISFGEAELILAQIALDEGDVCSASQHFGEAYHLFATHNEDYMVKRLKALEDRLFVMSDDERRELTTQLKHYWIKEGLHQRFEPLLDTCEAWEE
jgi:tetratricopeptide (TPR) repeat protein